MSKTQVRLLSTGKEKGKKRKKNVFVDYKKEKYVFVHIQIHVEF